MSLELVDQHLFCPRWPQKASGGIFVPPWSVKDLVRRNRGVGAGVLAWAWLKGGAHGRV